MLTEGFRTLADMELTLSNDSCDLIGLARLIAINPDFPNNLLIGKDIKSEVVPLSTGFKSLDQLLPIEIIWCTQQIKRRGKGRSPKPNAGTIAAVLHVLG